MKDVFDTWLNLAFPESVSICGQIYNQSDVLKKFDPITYDAYRAEWNKQEDARPALRLVS